ncbi:O-antigen ligase family protein [Hansschlegelia quercus]|uniref:O-antigen ligase-related domain-containing protein n=1 Tax=Hansschlegelia quercus TaxID=2528245 RepID=A0A4Q9GKZ9_9HYPH|nr:O-antigen ligase family protein [Hansschlegelia quercus]TBN54041.1 hypothetical protein EYR15_04045 [Hansschlegelia quercus]
MSAVSDYKVPAGFGAASEDANAFEAAVLTIALCIYIALFASEGVVRWVLNMFGADPLIFLRDAMIFGAIGLIVLRRFMNHRGAPLVVGTVAVLALHGMIGYFNMRGLSPVIAGAKPFLSLIIGAYCADRLFRPKRWFIVFLSVLFVASVIAGGLEKYFVEWPWVGLKADIGGQAVEISRDWQIGGADKRAAGLARSSAHLSGLLSCVGILLFFIARSMFVRLLIAVMTTVGVFWSTQKGTLAGVIVIFTVAMVFPKRAAIPALKWTMLILLLLMIGLPLMLPGYIMPSGDISVFSLQSFYDRAARMWPDAWAWYAQKSVPFFGVGLGGIGYAMRMYSPDAAFYVTNFAAYEPYYLNSADNMFVYLYVQFGVMSLLYIGLIAFYALRQRSAYDQTTTAALAMLAFIFAYGVVANVIEDQISCLFFGAAIYILFRNVTQDAREPSHVVATPPKTAAPFDPYRVAFVPKNPTRTRA